MNDLLPILKQMFLTHAVKIGNFTLSSGKKSDVYIDSKNVMFRSDGINLLGRLIYENSLDLNITAVGGMETGAIPLVAATLNAYHTAGKKLNGFFVRKTPKGYGKKSLIEGYIGEGDRVLMVEDVVTTGTSTFKAVNEVYRCGAVVERVIAICDREENAIRLLPNLRSLFKLSDLDLNSLRG